MSKKRLGRGLDALLSGPSPLGPDVEVEADAKGARAGQGGTRGDGLLQLAIGDLVASPYQPRRHFDADALQELAASISSRGVLQPVVVRERAQGGYELIAGERRWRAAELAGLAEIPAVVRSVTDQEASALALIENMQREDLNALEEATGLARLRDEFELTQQQIADAVGKSRVAIANTLRLLNLGNTARTLLTEGALDMGHARALLAVDGFAQDQLARQVADQGLSVRQTEALVRKQGVETRSVAPRLAKDPDTQRLEARLTDQLGAPVSIRHFQTGRGELSIKYSSLDELEGVLKHLGIESS